MKILILILVLFMYPNVEAAGCGRIFLSDKDVQAMPMTQQTETLLPESVPYYFKVREEWFNYPENKQYKKENYPPLETKEWIIENGLVNLMISQNGLIAYKKGQNPNDVLMTTVTVEIPLFIEGQLKNWIMLGKFDGSWENNSGIKNSEMNNEIFRSIEADKAKDPGPKKYFFLHYPAKYIFVLKETPQGSVVWYLGAGKPPYPDIKAGQQIPLAEFVEKFSVEVKKAAESDSGDLIMGGF